MISTYIHSVVRFFQLYPLYISGLNLHPHVSAHVVFLGKHSSIWIVRFRQTAWFSEVTLVHWMTNDDHRQLWQFWAVCLHHRRKKTTAINRQTGFFTLDISFYLLFGLKVIIYYKKSIYIFLKVWYVMYNIGRDVLHGSGYERRAKRWCVQRLFLQDNVTPHFAGWQHGFMHYMCLSALPSLRSPIDIIWRSTV